MPVLGMMSVYEIILNSCFTSDDNLANSHARLKEVFRGRWRKIKEREAKEERKNVLELFFIYYPY